MVGGGYMVNDLDDNAMAYGDVFEDLLDFSNDGMQLLMEPEPLSFDDGLAAADSAFPPLADAPSVGAPGATVGIKSDDTTFPCDDVDVAELEWLSNFVEESFSAASMELPQSDNNNNMTIKNNNNNMIISSSNNNNDGVEASGDDNKFELHCRTPSPVSVLEHNGLIIGGGNGGSFLSSSSSPVSSSPTSSSCSSVGGGVKVLVPFNQPEHQTSAVRGRAPRTKRARPPSGPRSNVLLPIVASSTEGTHGGDSLLMIPSVTNHSEVENLGGPKSNTPESQADQVPPLVDGNNNKKKLKIVSSAASIAGEGENSQVPVRKCLHCEIQKTPQWRAGPMGPKTLCNACGVRYKSGRLFPEYRPAASPTFVSSLHSNSHKKVVEMRVRAASKKDSSAVAPSLPASAKGCELLNYIRGN